MCSDEGGEEGEYVEGASGNKVVPIRCLLVMVRSDNTGERERRTRRIVGSHSGKRRIR